MAISRDKVEFGNQKIGKDKLSPGRYRCRVLDVRSNDTRSQGEGYFIDFEITEVLSGDSIVGTRSSYPVFPDSAKGSVAVPKDKAKSLEEGKFVVAVAACMGKTRDEVEFVTQARLDAAMKRPKSPLAGRSIIVISVPYINKRGEDTSYLEIEPDLDGEKASEPVVEEKPKTKQPPKPGKKAAPQFPPAGWESAEDDDGDTYYYNEATGESLYEADLRAKVAA
jgi:hypothetical protein